MLVLLVNCTRKTLLKHCISPTWRCTEEALLKGRAHLGFLDDFLVVTDIASHFAKRLSEDSSKELNYTHTYSITYSSWSKWSTEVTKSRILKHLRQLDSEYSLYEADRPRVLHLITHMMNNFPYPSRVGRSASFLFLGFDEPDLLVEKRSTEFRICLEWNDAGRKCN